nr:hypothetical protein Iba_chr15aCG5250 [Ipomoea batatas]
MAAIQGLRSGGTALSSTGNRRLRRRMTPFTSPASTAAGISGLVLRREPRDGEGAAGSIVHESGVRRHDGGGDREDIEAAVERDGGAGGGGGLPERDVGNDTGCGAIASFISPPDGEAGLRLFVSSAPER